MSQRAPPASPPPPPPGQGQPPFPTEERPPLPAGQIGLWVVLMGLLIFVARPSGEMSSYQVGRWVGGIVLPLLIGAGVWALAGRRGRRKADMRSPALVAIALPIALIGWFAESRGDDGGDGNGAVPTKAELSERFVPVPELAYARLPAEAEAQVESNIESFGEFAETHEVRILVDAKGGEKARVLALGFDAGALGATDTNDFIAGVADGMESSSGSPTREVSVGGVDGVLGETQGTYVLMLPDTEDGTVLFVYASDDSSALDVGEHLVTTF